MKTLNEYEAAAMRTAKDMGSIESNLTHAALGVTSDAGEFATVVKRVVCYGKPIDSISKEGKPETLRDVMIEELGDTLWFIVLAAQTLGTDLEAVAAANIAKLKLRYPAKYSDAAAEARADKGGLTAHES